MPITAAEAKLGLSQIKDELMDPKTPWPRHRQLVHVQNKLLGVVLCNLPCEWVDIQLESEQENEERLAGQRNVPVSDVRDVNHENRSSKFGRPANDNGADDRSIARTQFEREREDYLSNRQTSGVIDGSVET